MGGKQTTIKEIASLLNISVSTVSRALHKHPSIGITTQLRVQKLADELNYEPNQAAIFFQKGKSYTIGLILPELSEAFFSSVVNAVEDMAYKKNYTVLLAQSHDDEDREKQIIQMMKNHRVDGLVVSVAKTTTNFDHFHMLEKYNIPIVFFDRIPPLKNIHSVACNIETGSLEAVNYLLKKGHRCIGLINGPAALTASEERKKGYFKAITKNRLKFDPSLIVSCDLTEKGTQEALTALMENKRNLTAIVTFNDYVALYAIKYARKLNIDLKNDLQFISYSNLPLINYMDHVPIASVEQFPYKQGEKAVEILFDLINNKDSSTPETMYYNKVVVESELIENQSYHTD
ncbi:MAG TPA: LacI family DNA-binding transcriptional regulator [Pedobacter sp.]|nr:LacI family DNA-binding transcriptional regulator [Pedobacter sp.]